MTKALYAFSADPITYGHVDIVRRTASLFDHVTVGIGTNPAKQYMFTLEERVAMANNALLDIPNVNVTSFSGLLVDYAYEHDIPVVVKGIRDMKDFDYELTLHEIGETQQESIETIFIPAKPELRRVSSSAAKAIQKEHGNLQSYVTPMVKAQLEARMSKQYIIGLTGEIGSGKSFVGGMLSQQAELEGTQSHNIELDAIGHDILGSLQEERYVQVRQNIIEVFGKSVAAGEGFIDRKALGEIVFGNRKKLDQLDAIMRVPLEVQLRKALRGKEGLIIINAALLAESNMLYTCNNSVVLVNAEQNVRQKRMEQRGLTPKQISRRVKSQYSAKKKEKYIQKAIAEAHYGFLWEIDSSQNVQVEAIGTLYEQISTALRIKPKLR